METLVAIHTRRSVREYQNKPVPEDLVKELLAAGFGDRILLSHDAGCYQPGQPNGGTQKPYTYLHKTFLPKLKNSGLSDAAIRMLTEENPGRAFAFMRRSSGSPGGASGGE